MSLGDITECNHKNRGDQFRDSRKKVKMFHQKLEEEIIEKETETDCEKVPEKLNPAPQRRSCEYNETHQKKSCRETH